MEFDVEDILTEVIQKLKPLDAEGKKRVLSAIATFYSLGGGYTSSDVASVSPSVIVPQSTNFSEKVDISPKGFLREKAPKSDVEKVVCIAYFLNHYRDTPHFKTIDISKLNTEAAQLKFSNAAYTVDHASKRGFLVPAGKSGMKQISSMGEQFVAALPDREAAKAVLEQMKVRKPSKKYSRAKESMDDSDVSDSD